MADFLPTTACNSPRIKDHKAVDQIVASYYFDADLSVGTGFDEADGTPYLFVYGCCWPAACKLPAGETAASFDPYSTDAWDDSAKGFIDFLKEVAPHLVESLTVQAIGAEKCRFPLSACEWHVQPGAKRVKVNSFRHCDPEPVVAGR